MGRGLIVGCGDVGTALGLRLVDSGWKVWGLRRTRGKLPSTFGQIAADIRSPLASESLPNSIDTVFFAPSPDRRDRSSYAQIYVTGLRNTIDVVTAREARSPRLILASSTAVYGQSAGEVVDETSPTEPRGFNGDVLLQAEEIALRCPLETVVARFGGIYGVGRLRLVDAVRSGAACQEDPPRFTNRIHRDDCAGVLAHLAQRTVAPGVFVAVDDAPVPECEVLDFIADELGTPHPPRLQVAGGERGKRCLNCKLRESGYRFAYPTYREGYASLISRLND